MSNDWIGRPLDILLGYTPGIPLPTVQGPRDRQWHPEDHNDPALNRLRSEDSFAYWRAKKLYGHAQRLKTVGWDKQIADDVRRVRSKQIVTHLIASGIIDMTDIVEDADKERAEGALVVLVSIATNAAQKASDRVAAAKAVLDFTRQRPATKADVKVNALDWLDVVSHDA